MSNLFKVLGAATIAAEDNVFLSDTIIAAIITGLFAVFIVILTPYINKRYKKKNKVDELKLESHPFFTRMDVLKNHIHNSFVLKNKGKEAVFKDILWNHITITQDGLMKFIQTLNDNEGISTTEFYNLSMTIFNEIVEKQNTYYLNMVQYTKEDKEVLEKVLIKFNTWNADNMIQIQHMLDMISTSCFYTDQRGRAGAVLDFYTGVSVYIINSASKTLNALNGDLEGLTFKGIKM